MNLTEQQAEQQFHYLQESGFQYRLASAAQAHEIPAVFVYAIASRETNCRNILGDWHDGQAHGVGILQIDIQQPLAKTMRDNGTWQTSPAPLINFGVNMMAENIGMAKMQLPQMGYEDQLKVAASGYNCGMGRAVACALAGEDSDKHTTGGDYGKDVVTRMALFASIVSRTETPATD